MAKTNKPAEPAETAVAERPVPPDIHEELQRILIAGDLSKLTPEDRTKYYAAVCRSLNLNPLTRPFDFIVLNGKLQLYARKDCTEQLRRRDQVSVQIVARELIEGVYVVTARASVCGAAGVRSDEAIGAVTLRGLQDEARANAIMKAETKAKRRVTLSICGLGFLDEIEAETVVRDPRPAEIAGDEPAALPPAKPAESPPSRMQRIDAALKRTGKNWTAALQYAGVDLADTWTEPDDATDLEELASWVPDAALVRIEGALARSANGKAVPA